MARRFIEREQVSDFVGTAFGASRQLMAVTRLTGGSQKGVYRLTLDGGATAVLYAWSPEENYWPKSTADPTDPLAGGSSAADLFRASRAALAALGVRTPDVYLLDTSRSRYPADLALVEDVPGETLEALIARDPAAAGAALDTLAAALRRMAEHRSPHLGKVALVQGGRARQDRRPERVVLDRALRHLDTVAGWVEPIGRVRSRIEDLVGRLAAAVSPREGYGLVHGELGPDHVLLDAHGQPVMIDIEGAMFFDIEWEHAFVQLRFGPRYPRLRLPGLDPARMEFYRLAQSLSLIEGPMRIAEGDFPGREFMLGIARYHTDQVLAAVG